MNPRRAGRCDCGVKLAPKVYRDRRFEDETTSNLLQGTEIDTSALNIFAGRRADEAEREHGREFPDVLGRDMAQEACEEQADARNYAVWWLDAFNRGLIPDSEHWKAGNFQRGLKYTALAFHEFAEARR